MSAKSHGRQRWRGDNRGLNFDLAGAGNELLAHFTGVGEERLVALDAVRVLLLQDVLQPVQGVVTLCAVVALSHVA